MDNKQKNIYLKVAVSGNQEKILNYNSWTAELKTNLKINGTKQ